MPVDGAIGGEWGVVNSKIFMETDFLKIIFNRHYYRALCGGIGRPVNKFCGKCIYLICIK